MRAPPWRCGESLFDEKEPDHRRGSMCLVSMRRARRNRQSRTFGETNDLTGEVDVEISRKHEAGMGLLAPAGLDKIFRELDEPELSCSAQEHFASHAWLRRVPLHFIEDDWGKIHWGDINS